jgi:hypothetical protein
MADRKPRASETRETETRRKPWAPPSHLAAPDAPDGYVHRWIRVAMRGEEDKMNVNSKLREGWEPVRQTSIQTMKHLLLTMVVIRVLLVKVD